jgi:cytochrome P450
MATRRSEL